MKRSVLSLSLEAARFQSNPAAFQDFQEEFRKLRAVFNNGTKVFSHEDFAPLMAKIKEHFSIQAEFVPGPRSKFDFGIFPPDVDANNPIALDDARFYRESAEGISHLRRNAGRVEGGVDLDGRVYGVFAKMKAYFSIGMGWFYNEFEPHHLAALLLHEVGHYDSYVRAMSESVTMNTILAAVAQEWSGADAKTRVVLLDKAAQQLDINLDSASKEQAARLGTIEGVATVLITNRIIFPRSANNTSGMDYSQWEAASDQFAVRMGAGLHLAEMLNMAHRYSPTLFMSNRNVYLLNIGSMMSSLLFGGLGGMAVGTAAATAALPMGLITGAVVALTVFWLNGVGTPAGGFASSHDTYDYPVRRVERIFVEMRAELKNKSLPPERLKVILRNLDDVKMMISEYYSAVPLAYRFASMLSAPSYKSMRYREQQQRRLESLANNELFVAAANARSA